MKPQSLFDSAPKRKKPVMLTGRSRKFLEQSGFLVSLVERNLNIPRPGSQENFRRKFDAFGIADLIAVKAEVAGTLYIQVTDFSHGAEHKEKILAAKASPVLLQAQNQVHLHLWKAFRKNGRKLWKLHVYSLCENTNIDEVYFSDCEERWFYDNRQEYDEGF